MRRVLWILLPLIASFIVLMLTIEWLKPSIQSWAIKEIENYSAANFPFIVRAKELNVQFIAPSLKASRVEIIPKDAALFGFKQLRIEEVRLNLDFLQILGGKLFLSSVILDSPELNLDLDVFKSDDSKKTIDLSPLFDLLKEVPIYRIALLKSRIEIESSKNKFKIRSSDVDLYLVNLLDKVLLKAEVLSGHIYFGNTGSYPFELKGDARLDAKSLAVQNLALTSEGTNLIANVQFKDIANILIKPSGKMELQGSVQLESLKSFLFEYDIPVALAGKIDTDANFKFTGADNFDGTLKLNTAGLKINQFEIGDLEINSAIKDHKITSRKIVLGNPSGEIVIDNLELGIPKTSTSDTLVRGKISSDNLDLNELLNSLGLKDLPLELLLDAALDCEGLVFPKPNVTCTGFANGDHLEVRSGEGIAKTIAQVDEFKSKGFVNITDLEVRYEVDLKVKDSEGKSSGAISYKDGFMISYSSPNLNLKNIEHLAGLKLEGSGQLEGQTVGDSGGATFYIQMNGKDLYLDDFMIGQAKALIKYQKSILSFENIVGSIGGSKYSAQVKVNLDKKQIAVDGHSENIDANDVMKAFARRVQLPFEIYGSGVVDIRVRGPFAFNLLSYDLQAQLYRGSIAGESYDRLNARIKSEKGEVRIERFLLDKKKASIQVGGLAHPNGQIEVTAEGNGLPIEDSENIAKLGASMSGIFNFNLTMNGYILKPDIQFRGNLKQLLIEDQEFPDSTINWKLSKQAFDGNASLLGDRLKAELLWPFNDNSPFKLKVKARNWNFATLFTLVGGASLLSDYRASLSGELDLSSERGGILKSSGTGTISDFLLKRGSLSLKNQTPMLLTMKDGVAKFDNFKVTGQDSIFHISGDGVTKDNLNLKIQGKTDLRLFHIFVPFLDDFSGAAQIEVQLSGPLTKPEILGNASVRDGYARLKAFPHPFEKIGADIQFSQSKVLLSNIKGVLAGGILNGDGQILIEGLQNIPMSIKGHLENANLNVPDGIRTNGDADVEFSGNWFPFTLSGVYRIKSGSITKEFGGEDAATGLRQSAYLPKIILKSAFEPVILDLQIKMERPLLIKNQLMDGQLIGDLNIRGPPSHPALLGKISMERNSKLYFRDKVFEVGTGNIEFKNPDDINPELYITGRGRVSDYDINLLVQGAAKDPQVRLTSTPPLSEQDIVSLLALGVLANKQDAKFSADRASRDEEQTAAALISTIVNNTETGKKLRNYGVNIQVSSNYDNTKDSSTQVITISKTLTDKLTVSGSYLKGKQRSSEVHLRYNINNNVSAIGSLQKPEGSEDATQSEAQKRSESVLGLDLEYKQEFR